MNPAATLTPGQKLQVTLKILPADRVVGFMHITQLTWLATRAALATSIVEIGSYRGRSTRALCDNCPGKVTAVDTWRGSPGLEDELELFISLSQDPEWLYHEFLYNTRDSTNLEILRMSSLAAAAQMRLEHRCFDMIFIDALHDYSSVRADIRAWLPLLVNGGLMCGHDLRFQEVGRAVRDAFPGFSPIGDDEPDLWAVCKGAGSIARWGVERENSLLV